MLKTATIYWCKKQTSARRLDNLYTCKNKFIFLQANGSRQEVLAGLTKFQSFCKVSQFIGKSADKIAFEQLIKHFATS